MRDEPGHVESWIRYFTALARFKNLKDEKASERENEIEDLFLAMAGCEAVKRIFAVAYYKN